MDLNEDLSWRQCNYLGFLELEPVLDEPLLGTADFPLTTPEKPSLKRPNGREEHGEDDEEAGGKSVKTLRSNKDRVVQVGVPETLPSFRQNTLQDKELVLVEQVVAREKQLRQETQAIYTRQKNAQPLASDAAEGLRKALIDCQKSAREQKQLIESALGRDILKPGTLAVLERMLLSLEQLECVSSVCEAELRGERKAQVALIRVEDSFTRPLKQDESVSVSLKLVRSPNLQAGAPTHLSVITVHDNDPENEVDLGLKIGKVTPFFTAPDCVEFPQFCITKASRKKLVSCVFRCVLNNGAPNVLRVQSAVSSPFVVTSNEKQWHEAYGSILSEKIFAQRADIPTKEICNELQRAYLVGTRQHTTDPPRPLSPFDFDFILTQNFANSKMPSMTRDQFTSLWEWFGTILSRIRHDKAIWGMWTQGFIMGFLSKEESEALLIKEPPGTFLLRFSSQAPGSLAIAYTAPHGGEVSHYLIRKNDVNVSQSLAKFLLDRPFFSILLQTVPSFQERKWQRADKLGALSKWEKKGADESVPGYDETLNIPFGNLKI